MSHRRFLNATLAIIAGIAFVSAFTAFILLIIDKIRKGQGLDYYFTGHGVQFTYIGAAVLLAIIPVALLVGWALNYWLKREERDFEKRFGRRRN